MLTSHEIEIRVRYQETDAQGRVHHANYLTWFELGRVELMRASGQSYRDVEAAGVFLVIAKAEVKYVRGAVFDDLLKLRIKTVRAQGARIDHQYEIFRDAELIAEGATTLACVDRDGRIARLPEWLRSSDKSP
jgi:acyl-CoA thioester hydrolase